jgi:hypothetical protein
MISPLLIGGITDSTKKLKEGVELYEGQPVALDENGEIIPATNTTPVYGLSKLDANRYKDYVRNPVEGYDSGYATVVKATVVKVGPSTYRSYETMEPSGLVVWVPYDETVTFAINDKLYVNSDGKITNVATGNEASYFGNLVGITTVGGYHILEIDLKV